MVWSLTLYRLLEKCSKPTALVLVVLLGGCQSLEFDRSEIAWLTMHAVDVAQTLSAAHDPCYVEDAWLTEKLIGEQPSDAEVLLWGVGTAVVHALVSNLLEDRAPRWVQKVWDYGTITHTGYAVMSNHDEGVRAFGSNQDVAGCSR